MKNTAAWRHQKYYHLLAWWVSGNATRKNVTLGLSAAVNQEQEKTAELENKKGSSEHHAV